MIHLSTTATVDGSEIRPLASGILLPNLNEFSKISKKSTVTSSLRPQLTSCLAKLEGSRLWPRQPKKIQATFGVEKTSPGKY